MIAKIDYRQVSRQDLTLAIFDCLPNRNDFQIIEETNLQSSDLTLFGSSINIRLAVIGASHLVELQVGSTTFSEVFSCRKNFKSTPVRLFNVLPKTIPEEIHCNIDNLSSRYKMSIKSFHENEITVEALRIFLGSCSDKIWVNFPSGEYDGIPFTAIGATISSESIAIRSIHGYNHEKRIILSESEISVRKDTNFT